MYLAKNGDELTIEQITNAFNAGKAVLVHSNRENGTDTGLMIDGKNFDTRGKCYSVWDEVWTQKPKNIKQCFGVARV